ncbi:hypothetical protein B4417_2255 [Bacillus subtilis]|nr:hypothetical protein ABU16_0801 [Bacillus subtilis]EME08528.1 hypothetical protein BS732_0902 [Bacillus subtilis MB73/2]KZD80654.1 hypothetical protein B4417_2255 [Bacillus subtilis]
MLPSSLICMTKESKNIELIGMKRICQKGSQRFVKSPLGEF